MKNIAFLPVLVIILFSLISIYSAFCDEQSEKNYNFSFGISTGFVYGQSIEIVYPYDTPAKYLSELLWDMKPVYYLGLQADFERYNIINDSGLFASLTFNVGIPAVSGIMEDRDWMNTHNEALTHYSKHTNKTREFFWLDAAFGFSIPINNFFNLKPFLNAGWMRFAFTARDGYGEYDYPGWPDYVSYKDREVIRYDQNWLLIAAGLSIETQTLFPFFFEISFKISPLIFCSATDVHLPSVVYKDYMGFGLFMEPEAIVSFRVKKFAFSLKFSYRYIGGTKGITYINEGFAENNSGSGLSVINTRFIVRYIM